MSTSTQQVATLEWVNYEAGRRIAEVTPDLELHLRPDVILTSSQVFPAIDTTHACLLRTTPQRVDQLITEITDYFQARSLPAAIFVSPACTPSTLPERLQAHGFAPDQAKEAWLVFEDVGGFKAPAATARIPVTQVPASETYLFAKTFTEAFELPPDTAPALAQLLEPSLGLPGVYHFVAWVNDQPAATLSLICHGRFGIIGSAGVVPPYRGSRAASNLALAAFQVARREGVDCLILQTTAGTMFERFLRISGFKHRFTRQCYKLS